MLPGFNGHLVSEAYLESLAPLGASAAGRSEPAIDRVHRDLVTWRMRTTDLGPASASRTLLQDRAAPLFAALGFDPPTDIDTIDSSVVATVAALGQPITVIVAPWGERLDPLWRLAVTQAMRRASAWCLLFNGVRLRVVDANRLYARRYLEFDLDLAIDDARTLLALWRTTNAAALGRAAAHDRSLHAIVDASDRHAATVCRSLREGVLAASGDILGALVAYRRGAVGPSLHDSFEQALTIVYRILFLLFAEARSLVPLWHPVYRDSYSIEALRHAVERSRQTTGLWDALRAIGRLAHAGCRAGDLRVTPFNGRLFAPARTPLAERRDLDEAAAHRAILALSTRTAADGAGRQRIGYRDLGVEQLGAVYETLLDYEPRSTTVSSAAGRRALLRVTLEPGSGLRKATGTFYTPQPIAEYVVRRTLAPLVRDASSDRILGLRVVDPSMGSGAFLVAACRYLSGAYEAALIREGRMHPVDVTDDDRASMRRAVAERCLYGVDLNPMAVQLARLSLWLATLAADRPLSFLDHRLLSGDSLLGAWVTNLKRPPVPPRRGSADRESLPLFEDETVRAALSSALPVRFALESTPNDTLDQVRAKERALAAITAHGSSLSRWKRIADVWCASWFAGAELPATAFSALTDATLTGSGALPARLATQYLDAARAAADARRFFHWELEFPEVFFGDDGRRLDDAGFDAVIGNPPWDMIRADAGSREARSQGRSDVAAVVRFTRQSGIYASQSDGHANRYQLFVERAIDLTRAGGRIGLVLPSGLATDGGSASIRRRLLTACEVDAMVGIDNHRGVFPIHRSVRFLLVTATRGQATRQFACRFGLDAAAELETIGDDSTPADDRSISLSTPLLERVSGPDLTIPAFRSRTDLAIVERAASLFPSLGDAAGWSAAFGRELNATDDRDLFTGREHHRLPVVEGKHLEPFHVALHSVAHFVRASDARRRLEPGRFERARLAYRDVASATNRLTLIAAVLPAGCVSTHTVFCLRTELPLAAHYFLCGLFNSFVVNYLVRLRVTTHVTTATVERLPIARREMAPAAYREIAALARLLSRKYEASSWATLNARVAGLYRLSTSEFEHVLGTFPLIGVEERQRAFKIFAATVR
jgi:Eco57I restriction-modification methylase